MVKTTAIIAIAAALPLLPSYASAQAKVIPGERQTIKATVEAVDMSRRRRLEALTKAERQQSNG